MTKRRMSDTAALTVGIYMGEGREHHSKSSRKIENGYVHSESHEKNGEYTSREYFSRSPLASPGKAEGGSVGPEGLRGAIDEACK